MRTIYADSIGPSSGLLSVGVVLGTLAWIPTQQHLARLMLASEKALMVQELSPGSLLCTQQTPAASFFFEEEA